MSKLIMEQETYRIVGSAMAVYNELGTGFLEAVYQEALEIELGLSAIPFEPQRPLGILYKGRQLEKRYAPDLVCFGKIIVELKAVRELTQMEEAQLLNYLKASGTRLGLLLNFGNPSQLEWKRRVV